MKKMTQILFSSVVVVMAACGTNAGKSESSSAVKDQTAASDVSFELALQQVNALQASRETRLQGYLSHNRGTCSTAWDAEVLDLAIAGLPEMRDGIVIVFSSKQALEAFARSTLLVGDTVKVRSAQDQPAVEIPVCGQFEEMRPL